MTRDFVAGISSTNLSLLNHLLRNDHEFVGIELTDRVHMKGPVLFRAFPPQRFDHHIINIHHLPISDVIRKSKTLGEVQKRYASVIRIIRGILRETKPDLVLVNGTSFIPWLISVAAHREKIPIVLWYAGVLTREVEHYPRAKRIIFMAMERSIIRRAQKIIFPSALCKRTVEAEVAKRKLRNSIVVPNPIASTFMEPSVPHPLGRAIAAVGRYTPVKNFDAFFRLHTDLLKLGWEHTATFVTKANKRLLEVVPKTLRLVPPKNAEELKEFYLSQGLIICPSRFETFGNAPMEAACLGVPVLVNETMGCAEVLKAAGLSSMVVDFEDREAALERIQRLCGQHILPEQLTALHRMLDYRTVGEAIERVLTSCAPAGTESSAADRPAFPQAA